MEQEAETVNTSRLVGLVAGGTIFAVMLFWPPPFGLSEVSWSAAALAMLMAIWWMTEAVPLPATALAPVIVLPILSVRALNEVAPSYAHPLVLLFLGGFLIAKALERWSLHKRIAGTILGLAPAGPAGIIAALMVATAFLSMWISNTAAAMVMVPIAQSIAESAGRATGKSGGRSPGTQGNFAAALLLGVAFSATIGGMATLIGTPPNALLAGYLHSAHSIDIGFGQWMMLGIPVTLILLPITWLLLTRIVFSIERGPEALGQERSKIIEPSRLPMGARLTAIIISLAGLALIFRPLIQDFVPVPMLSDAGIALAAAAILMLVPSGDGKGGRLLEWEQAKTIRWDVLILFGGGLALADAIEVSGLSQAIGALFTSLQFLPMILIVLISMALVVYLGELASNTAMAAIFLPIAGAAAISMNADVLDLVIPIGLAASLGFMLPVATPPNAIAYGTGAVTSAQMLKSGVLLDITAILITYAVALMIGPIVFAR